MGRHALAVACCIVLASCATTAPGPDVPPRGMQDLTVRTQPEGARCSLSQGPVIVASVEATPATVAVSRDLCRGGVLFCPAPEKLPPLEIVCEKEGYLPARRTLSVAWVHEIAAEDRTVQATPDGTSFGLSFAANAAFNAAIYFPAAGIPISAALMAGSIAYGVENPTLDYAYSQPAEIFLIPVEFESTFACDAFFASLAMKLDAARDARLARIDAQCRYWPCTSSGPACANPVCERQRERVNAELKTELSRIPELRAQVRIAPP